MPLPFDADVLDVYISNDQKLLAAIQFAVKQLQTIADRAAEKLAKENAAWHDDPAAEDHKDFHAPADVQFPREVRNEAILGLVKFYLEESLIQAKEKP